MRINTVNKTITALILFSLALLITSSSLPPAQAQVGVGASPSSQHFENLLRGGYAEGYITVSVNSDEYIGVSVEPRGDIKEWFSFPDGTSFKVKRDSPARIKFLLLPPTDAANGRYAGHIRFSTSSLGTPEGQIGSSVQVGIDAVVTATITDQQYLKCRATSLQLKDTEESQPIIFSANIQNEGNVRVRPSVDVTLWNQKQDKILKTYNVDSGKEILPTTKDSISVGIQSSDLKISQYWASVTVTPCGENRLLSFDVREAGSLSLDGVLKTIITNIKAEVGEITPVIAVVQNIGESAVKARFKGNVESSGRIVELLESEELLVQPGSEMNLTTFFTPKEPGRYIIKGRVYYGNKQTFENTGIVNVLGTKINYPVIIVYTLVVALLIFIIFRLRTRRR